MPGYLTAHHGSYPTIHQPDVTLILDPSGIIREASLSNDLPGQSMEEWIGRPWMDTVGDGGSDQIRDMLDNAMSRGVSAFRLINQRFPNGIVLPVEYSTVRLGGKSGLIAIGKNQQAVAELEHRLIAAQQAREQDYWKLREVETRYRLLFDASHEAVLLIRADNLAVVEANLAALRVLSLAPGQDVLGQIPQAEHAMLRSMLVRVREQGRAPGVLVHLGLNRAAWIIRASLMASEPGPLFLLQLAPAGGEQVALRLPPPSSVPTDDLLEKLPDAFVVLDHEGIVLRANDAFLDLVRVGSEGAVVGERLSRWMQRPGADMAVLLATLQRHRTVRLMSTAVQTEGGEEIEVEISAAIDQLAEPRHVAVLLRDVSRRSGPAAAAPAATQTGIPALLGALADQIGQTPLPKLMRETVELLERHYIEAALERADGNRTATAELLGLSRQSLYVKLNRYGLDGDGRTTIENPD